MPLYEFRCAACGTKFDEFFSLPTVEGCELTCPKCTSEECEKLISLPSRPHVSSPEWLKETSKALGKNVETRQEMTRHMKANNLEFY